MCKVQRQRMMSLLPPLNHMLHGVNEGTRAAGFLGLLLARHCPQLIPWAHWQPWGESQHKKRDRRLREGKWLAWICTERVAEQGSERSSPWRVSSLVWINESGTLGLFGGFYTVSLYYKLFSLTRFTSSYAFILYLQAQDLFRSKRVYLTYSP